ncbi:MAG: hypothetical protein JNM28_01575 [Armatimonadetes bacterium]|nr:hypothetical protein [Armatimonadota bacterium]
MLTTILATLLFHPVQEVRRDFMFPVMPVHQLADWLHEEVGKPVFVVPEVRDRMVYIHLKNRTFAELYDLLEQAAGVKVSDKNGALTLMVSPTVQPVGLVNGPGLQKELDSKPTKMPTRADIEEAIPELARIQKAMQSGTFSASSPDFKKWTDFANLDPAAVAAAVALRGVGVQNLLGIRDFERVVYSTQPTRMQRPWPGKPAAELQSLNAAMQIRNEVVEATENMESFGMVMDSNRLPMSQLQAVAGGLARPVAAMTLSIRRMPYMYMVTFSMYDKDGGGIAAYQTQLTGLDMEGFASMQERVAEATKDLTQEMKLSGDERDEIRRINAMFGGNRAASEAVAKDIEWLAHVDEHEPFSGVVSRIFDFGADQTGNEVICEVLMPTQALTGLEKVTAGQAFAALLMQSPFGAMEPSRNSLVISKPMPSWIYQFLVSRPAIAQVARRAMANGRLTFDDLADGVGSLSQRVQAMLFVPAALSLTGQYDQSSYIQPYEWSDFLLFSYAALGPQQRKQVFSPEGLTVDVLTAPPAIRKLFADTVANSDAQMANEPRPRPDRQALEPLPGGIPDVAWNHEPSVFLTFGQAQPPSFHLRARVREGYVVERTYSSGGQTFTFTQFQSLDDLAMQQASMEAFPPDSGYTPPVMNGVAATQQLTVELTVHFGVYEVPGGTFTMLTQPSGKSGPIDSLPEAQRKKYYELLEKYRNEYKGIRGSPPPAHR